MVCYLKASRQLSARKFITASEHEQDCLLIVKVNPISSCEAPNTSNTQQTSHKLAPLLYTEFDQKLESFKQSFEEKDAIHASEIKKFKADAKASFSLKY